MSAGTPPRGAGPPPPTPDAPARPAAWTSTAERGSTLGIRLLIGCATLFGRRPTGLVLRLVALYYVLASRKARRALRAYYARLDGRHATWRTLWRHIFAFAQVTLDRLYFLKGRHDLFTLHRTGHEHLERLAAAGRGAILLSAHLGSQAAMGAEGHADRLRINIVGYFRNARRINAVMAGLNPRANARVVSISPGSVDAVLTIKALTDAGELVAVAGDRVGLNDRTVTVDFLGAPTRLPTAPFILASVLRCPVYLVLALYRAPDVYDLHCEPLTESLDVPRSQRDAAIAALAQRFAHRLEHYCRLAPDNWFNFYDFWSAP